MGHILSYFNISLDKPVMKSLETFTCLGMDELISIHRYMTLASNNSQMLSLAKADKILEGFFKNHSLLSEAFTFLIGLENEKMIHINTLICALCIFSSGSWIGKLRCNNYLVIFNLFTKNDGYLLDQKRLERLIKDAIQGFSIITGAGLPEEHCYAILAENIMEFAARSTVGHLHMDEFTNLINSCPIFMKLLKPRKSSTYTNLNISTLKLWHSPTRALPKKTSQNSFEKIYSVPSVPQSPIIALKLPVLQSPTGVYRIKRSKIEETSLGASFDFKRSFKIMKEDKQEPHKDMTDYSRVHGLTDFRKFNEKSRTEMKARFSEPVNEIPIHSNSHQDNIKLKKQILSHHELRILAKLYFKGDVDGKGWDKSDVIEIIGKKSWENARYIMQKYNVSSSNRLRFSDYLEISLPACKEFDASKVNEFYSIYRAQMIKFNM